MGRKLFFLSVLAGTCFALATPIHADSRAGVEAWTRGDFAAAVKSWQGEAAKGDPDAMFNLAQAFKLGKGVKQDLARAEDLFGKAAALGHIQASDNYGLLLFQRGQRTQALPFIRDGADRGDPRAQYLLGLGHFNGDIVPKDWVRAYALVSLAQQAGLEQAAAALGQMDMYVSMAQRQEAVALASELRSQADATRARQMAAADLGAGLPSRPSPASPAPANPDPVRGTADAAGSSPATAGADFARPAPARPVPARRDVPPAAPAPARVLAALPAQAVVSGPATASGPWRVQLGAFSVAANADALWNKLKGRPELSGRQRLSVKAGAVTKLQATGYPSEAAARAACVKLSAIGQTCIATRG